MKLYLRISTGPRISSTHRQLSSSCFPNYAFHNQSLLHGRQSFLNDNTIPHGSCLVVRKVLAKHVVAWLLLGALVISFALGITIAIITSRSDVGAGVAAGGFALVTAIQGLLAWIY